MEARKLACALSKRMSAAASQRNPKRPADANRFCLAKKRVSRQKPLGLMENMKSRRSKRADTAACEGFTLLEVLVALTVLAVGASLTLSLISGSLGNIRKVQLRTRTIEHARTVMELALLDDSIQQPTTFNGDFADGTRWSVRVEEYSPPETDTQPQDQAQRRMPVKLLHYIVEMIGPDSRVPDYRLQTLKLVRMPAENQPGGLPR